MRRPILSFTERARTGLLKSFAKVDQRGLELPLFVTLTYPRVYDPDPRRWKRDLKTLCQRVQRKWPHVWIQWRLEAQKRGAPHFHALVYGVTFIEKHWLSKNWYEVVGSGDKRHLRRGSRVERIRSSRGVQSYISKYMLKRDGDEGGYEFPPGTRPGRFWGIIGRANRPTAPVQLEPEAMDWHRVRRVVYGLQRSRKRAAPKVRTAGRKMDVKRRYRTGRYDGVWTFAGAQLQGQLLEVAGDVGLARAG